MIDKKAQKKISGSVIRLHPEDNVVIAVKEIGAGEAIPSENITSRHLISAGHKIATHPISKGAAIRKYNTVIGFAGSDIAPGSSVHNHNVVFRDIDRDYAYASEYLPTQFVPEADRATFQGIVRDDGRVATRNYIGICSTVNCSATVVRKIADWFTPERLAEYPNVDGVVAFSHPLGCGCEMTGEAMDQLRRTIAGYITQVNLAATLIVGLGCERNQIDELVKIHNIKVGPKLRTFVMQEIGGTRKTIEAGVAAVLELLPEANRVKRQTVSASHLTVGLECGGSDGFSSITANPALGAAADILVRHGGTAILSETPEIYGAEHTLTRRAVSVEVGKKLIERIRWWKDVYAVGRDVQINGVVSPGNQVGGLANILEKSLGSAMKGGTGPLMEVYKYAETVDAKGLVFMDSPGYDPPSVTGQIAGGATLIAFTTGRGSMFGSKPSPCIKLATNTPMYQWLQEDMDINCGEILDGGRSVEEMGQAIFELMLATASGKKSKSELLGLGDNEFAIWDIGIMG
ncbi:MAG: altronate dehydratase [Desulfofustis sp.]|nr:altronate dehydratase [Desulfofustis sp.]